jgi:hypothetical protein
MMPTVMLYCSDLAATSTCVACPRSPGLLSRVKHALGTAGSGRGTRLRADSLFDESEAGLS